MSAIVIAIAVVVAHGCAGLSWFGGTGFVEVEPGVRFGWVSKMLDFRYLLIDLEASFPRRRDA